MTRRTFVLQADAAMDMAERDFCQASLEYVFQLQAVQERKKFELVETLLGFVFGWWTFHHTAHDIHADAEPRVRDLQLRIQRVRGPLARRGPPGGLVTCCLLQSAPGLARAGGRGGASAGATSSSQP